MASDGKSVTIPGKSYRQRLEEINKLGASRLPGGEGGEGEGHQDPSRGPECQTWGLDLILLGTHQKGF